MSEQVLDGKLLKKLLRCAVASLSRRIDEINDLNVFPVPDGDTGINMCKTVESGIRALPDGSEGVGEVMKAFSKGTLLGARGNSGVILSQIFCGIAEGLSGKETVTLAELAEAYICGINKSYRAVSNPTEGTILTVFRESAERVKLEIGEDSTLEEFYKIHVEEARASLGRTKTLLPVLMEAGVVDSGGAGYLAIASGMYGGLTGEVSEEDFSFADDKGQNFDIDRFTGDSVMTLGYCTEFLLRLTKNKCDADSFDTDVLVSALQNIGGESIVAYKEGDVVKIHVHLNNPGDALNIGQRYGEFLTVKIENMELGHSDVDRVKDRPIEKAHLSVLAVACGEGMISLFSDMGADGIINGGQTSNPSAEQFLSAFEKYPAEHIIVLPNNKNVILAAKQAAELYRDGEVHIIPTASMMEGFGALSVINPGIKDIDTLVNSATRAAEDIVGSEVVRAVRDATVYGKEIKEGEYISISRGRISSVSDTRDGALLGALESIPDIDDREIITLFVGIDVDDEARVNITEQIEEKYPDHSLTVYKGKQEVYDYMVAVE